MVWRSGIAHLLVESIKLDGGPVLFNNLELVLLADTLPRDFMDVRSRDCYNLSTDSILPADASLCDF